MVVVVDYNIIFDYMYFKSTSHNSSYTHIENNVGVTGEKFAVVLLGPLGHFKTLQQEVR